MNDNQVWSYMLENDLDTTILVESLGLEKTIEIIRLDKQEQELEKILVNKKI